MEGGGWSRGGARHGAEWPEPLAERAWRMAACSLRVWEDLWSGAPFTEGVGGTKQVYRTAVGSQ